MLLGDIMKKISILSLHLGYGGIEKSIVALANILCQKYEVEIVCIYKLYDVPAFDIDNRVKITYLIESNLPKKLEEYKLLFFRFKWFKLIKKIFKDYFCKLKFITFFKDAFLGISMYVKRAYFMKKYIETLDVDVIVSSRPFLNEWLCECANSNIMKIGWEHNHHHNDMKFATNVARSARQLDYFVLVSNDLYNFYKKELSDYKCECVYIPNIIDSIPIKSSSLTEKRLVSVGRLSKEKGYLDLLKIYLILLKRHPDWVLDIIGDGAEREKLQRFIYNHNLEKNVTLHGFRDKEYIDKILHNSSIYVMTSFTESFGIVLIEAMSHGLPCIAFSSAEGACELISSGENGYLIKNRSYPAMVKKIEDLMEDLDSRKRLGKAGRHSVKKYTADVVKEQWYNLIEKK